MDAKPWWESKTMWVNILTVLIAALILVADTPILSPDAKTYLLLASGVANLVLRCITEQPIK